MGNSVHDEGPGLRQARRDGDDEPELGADETETDRTLRGRVDRLSCDLHVRGGGRREGRERDEGGREEPGKRRVRGQSPLLVLERG